MNDMAEFFEIHKDLPREGPGDATSLNWALSIAGVPANGHILDAGCGPGADIAALLAHVPDGRVTAVDTHAPFASRARHAFSDDPRVSVISGNMATVTGPFDLIWSAGAVYFLGVIEALMGWRGKLAPGGAVAFSEACWFTKTPHEDARALWSQYPAMTDEIGLRGKVQAAGYQMVDTLRLSDAAWETYYDPLEARIENLRSDPRYVEDTKMQSILVEEQAEIDVWRAHGSDYGYLLTVARPV